MVAFDPQSRTTAAPQRNVQGWERAASIGGGLLLLVKGARKGGVLGLVNMGIGGMGLLRGISGHCEAKRVFNRVASPSPAARLGTSPCSDTRPMPTLDMDAGPQAGADIGVDSRDPLSPRPNPII